MDPIAEELNLNRYSFKPRLKRSGPEQKLDNVPFVRLQPIELNRRHRSQIQSIDVSSVHKLALELLIIGDRAPTSVPPIRFSISS